MSNKLLIDAVHAEETRVVVIRRNRVDVFDYESSAKRQLRGNIYLAKVTRVEPSLQAAFVDYGGNRHGFLAFSEIHPDYYQIPVADRQALVELENQQLSHHVSSESGEEDIDNLESGEDTETGESPELAADHNDESEPDFLPDDVISEEDIEYLKKLDMDMSNGEIGQDLSTDEHQTESNDSELNGSSSNADDDVVVTGGQDDLDDDHIQQRSRFHWVNKYKIQEVIKKRQVLLVQVVKEERGNKGAALTTYLSLAGRYSVLMPNTARGGGISRKVTSMADRKRLKSIANELEVPKGMGVILRTAGANKSRIEIRKDFEYLARLWENVRVLTLNSRAPSLVYEEGSLIKRSIRDLYSKGIDKVIVAGETGYQEAKEFIKLLMPGHVRNLSKYDGKVPLFAQYKIESQLDALFSPTVKLDSGGYIVINQTEALVAIDVNSGKATREHNIEDTALKTNLEAAQEIARQMQLRDLAGLIVIDFIDMEDKRNIRIVERKFSEYVKSDRARIQIGRISHFGLLELSRQRLRTGMLEGSTLVCPTCRGAGIVRSVESIALNVLRSIEEALLKSRIGNINVKTTADVAVYILNRKRSHVRNMESAFGISIFVSIADQLPEGSFFSLERWTQPVVSDRDSLVVQAESALRDTAIETDEEAVEVIEMDDGDESQPAGASSGRSESRSSDRRRSRRNDRSHRSTERSDSGNEQVSELSDETSDKPSFGRRDGKSQGEESDQRRTRGRRRNRRQSGSYGSAENQAAEGFQQERVDFSVPSFDAKSAKPENSDEKAIQNEQDLVKEDQPSGADDAHAMNENGAEKTSTKRRKRAPSRRNTKEAGSESPVSEAADVEAKPKRSRVRKKADTTVEASAKPVDASLDAASVGASQSESKPKKPRKPRKTAAKKDEKSSNNEVALSSVSPQPSQDKEVVSAAVQDLSQSASEPPKPPRTGWWQKRTSASS